MKRHYMFLFCLTIGSFLFGCSHSKVDTSEVELTISAAASMENVIKDISENFQEEYPSITIRHNFGASGALEQQIQQGAPVDMFFSADQSKINSLIDEKLIDAKYSSNLVGNEIVLITSKDSSAIIQALEDLKLKAKKISIGTPEVVPAGKYAKEMFENKGLWQDIKSKIIQAKDVRQVLTYVETGNVDAGIVYRTDALLSNRVNIININLAASHSPILYPVGIIKNTKHFEEAQLFYKYLQNEKSTSIFKQYGFDTLK